MCPPPDIQTTMGDMRHGLSTAMAYLRGFPSPLPPSTQCQSRLEAGVQRTLEGVGL
jgi:hypothetical protein